MPDTKARNNTQLAIIVALSFLSLILLVFIVGIVVALREDADTARMMIVITAGLGAIGPVVGGLLLFLKMQDVQRNVGAVQANVEAVKGDIRNGTLKEKVREAIQEEVPRFNGR